MDVIPIEKGITVFIAMFVDWRNVHCHEMMGWNG